MTMSCTGTSRWPDRVPVADSSIRLTTSMPSTTRPNTQYPHPSRVSDLKSRKWLSFVLMKNWAVAEWGSEVRAMAMVPVRLARVLSASFRDWTAGRLARHSGPETAALDHEALDDAVKDAAVVEAVLDVAKEIGARLRGQLRLEFERDVAVRGLQHNHGHVGRVGARNAQYEPEEGGEEARRHCLLRFQDAAGMIAARTSSCLPEAGPELPGHRVNRYGASSLQSAGAGRRARSAIARRRRLR